MNIVQALMPVRMQKLRALILDEFVDDVLRALQTSGSLHVIDIKEALSRWGNLPQTYTSEQEIRKWQSILNRIGKVLSDLELKKELGLFEQLFKPRERPLIKITGAEEMELIKNAEEIIGIVEKEIEDKIKKFRVVRELLWELRTAKMSVDELRSSGRLCVKLGSVTKEEIPTLENELKSRVDYVLTYVSGKKRRKFIILISLAKFSQEIETILAQYSFQEVIIPAELSGDPNSCLRFMDTQSNSILKRYEKQILCLHDAIVAKLERLKTKEKLGKTKRTFVLEGWVPEVRSESVQALIEHTAKGYATVIVLPPDEIESKTPTMLKDRKLLGSFRVLTEMYGMPLYGEIDPTPFLAFFFIFFVGLMSADLAIGATVILSSFLIRRGAGSRSKNMKSLSVILLCIGVSTIFFGALMGEFMGGVVKLPIFWISAADNPMDFLFIVIGIGICHILFGNLLGFLNNFSKRKFRMLIGDQLSTSLMIGSAIFFLSTGNFEFQGLGIVAYSIGIVGFVMLIIGKGLTGMLELTRLLSNVISYVRILALNMATAWMGRTFVLLGALLIGVAIIGPILNVVILLFSHFFIVFISVFATFAHALRLHFVEFFGRFFIGGGTRFLPLTAERAYTRFKIQSEEQIEESEVRS